MIGNAVVQIEAAEPVIGEVQVDLFTQPPLGRDARQVDETIGSRSADLLTIAESSGAVLPEAVN